MISESSAATQIVAGEPAPLQNQSISVRFGGRLKALRREHGYTQVQLADYLGIDRSFISDVECGKKSMTLTYLETVALGFDMSVADLIFDL